MTHTPHELSEEFPGQADRIRDLKESDAHFRRLTEEYHHVNREIHRCETNASPADQFHEEDLRKKRLKLKDEIAGRLR